MISCREPKWERRNGSGRNERQKFSPDPQNTGCFFDRFDATERVKPEFATLDGRRGRWLHVEDLPKHFPLETTRFEIVPKPLWPVLFEILDGIPLEPWLPVPSIDRGIMLRIDGGPDPVFVMPTGYPERA